MSRPLFGLNHEGSDLPSSFLITTTPIHTFTLSYWTEHVNPSSESTCSKDLEPLLSAATGKRKEICPFCFQIFTPDNHKVRLRPKIKMTPHTETLLRKEAKSHRLNLKQTKLLRKYRCSRSILVVTCNTCKMVSKYPGESRNGLSNGPGTPKIKRNFESPDLRTPGTSRKVNLSCSEEKLSSKSKSPVLTPRSCVSAHSSPATTAKSAKKGKFQFSRLKMLLSQDEKEPSKKGDLQNFLTSLT